MTNTIQAVFFDIGGVYVKWSLDNTVRHVSDTLGVPEEDVREFARENMRGFSTKDMSEKDFYARASERFGVDKKDVEKLLTPEGLFNVNKGVKDIVKRLKASGYHAGAITDIDPPSFRANQGHGIYDIFDSVTTSLEAGCVKSGKRIFERAVAKAGARPEECVMIDDLPGNLETARNTGMKSILFSFQNHDADYLEKELKKLGLEF